MVSFFFIFNCFKLILDIEVTKNVKEFEISLVNKKLFFMLYKLVWFVIFFFFNIKFQTFWIFFKICSSQDLNLGLQGENLLSLPLDD